MNALRPSCRLRRAARAAAFVLAAGLAAPASAGTEAFRRDVAELTAAPHRLAGTPEGRAAADYLAGRLRAIGVDEVLVQEFPVAQLAVRRCAAVTADGRTLALVPMRPDGVIPPVTPAAGITGELLNLGRGTMEDFSRADPQGRIVVLDYNCEERWLEAFRLGARAVIFVRRGVSESRHFHYARVNANLPRFYYEGAPEDLPDGLAVTLHSEITWQPEVGRNVLGLLRGTAPVFDLKKEELLVVAAPFDTYGEAPQRTPGAQPAANCAALLRLAEHLQRFRPKRHVLVAFLDGQARNHAGAAALYQALQTHDRKNTIESRLESQAEETRFLADMERLAAGADPLAERTTDVGRELVNRIRDRSADQAYEVRAQLMDLREARAQEPRDSPRQEELLRRQAGLEPEKDRWNELRRQLRKGRLAPGLQPLFQDVLRGVREDIAGRQTELKRERAMLESSAHVKRSLGDCWIALHATLMLGNGTARWGVVIGGDSEIRSEQDQPGLYGRVQRSFLLAQRSLARSGRTLPLFETASVDGSLRQTRLLWAAPMLVHSGEIAGRYGIYNLVLGTMMESQPREGTPDDTPDRLDLDAIEQSLDEIALVLAAVGNQDARLGEVEAVADQKGLSLRRAIPVDVDYLAPVFQRGRATGALVMGRQRGSSIPNKPVPGAIVQVSIVDPWNKCFWRHNKAYAFDPFHVVRTDQNGAYAVPALPQSRPERVEPPGFAAAFDARGEVTMTSDLASRKTVRQRLNALRCRPALLVLPPGYWPSAPDFLTAQANALISNPTSERSYAETCDGVACCYSEEKLAGIKAFGLNSIVALANDRPTATGRADPYGVGCPVDSDWLARTNAAQAAGDLWRLNESRLALLRAKDILNSSLEEMHGRMRDLLDEARQRAAPIEREALAAAAFLCGKPVYEMVRAGMGDLIKAVLVLLALCIPFAFALERLLIGATMIYRQVAWFAGFFIATFILLYLSHPAFAIAQTPVIIFLGFAVVVLSGLVIFIIMQKFQVELKAMQGMTSTVHAADISRFSTVMAAMSMGISTMRRRPLRTALTAITIVLLTFTILGFASFDTQKGIIRIFAAPSPAYTGVLLHNPNWGSFNGEFVDIVRGRWARDAQVCVRYWICPEFPDDPDFVVAHADGSLPVTLKGILGIPPEELGERRDLLDLLRLEDPGQLRDMVLMTEAVAALLEVRPGDRVLLRGRPLTVGPLLDAATLSAARDMEGSSILPVDFATMKAAQAGTAPLPENLLDEQAKWTSLPVDSIVITSGENARLLGGKPHLVSVYTEDSQAASGIAEDLARMLDKYPVSATRQDGVYRHLQGTVVAASGFGDLFFPILLGGLVIFGTMLGSVTDREKEIYTFSALGLAPPHVASLFFSEALVYSVLGGLGGYLIAQGSLKVLSVLAGFGWVQVPEMNYSSTNAIVTILIVMATVLVSAIYPAVKASRSANPGLMRLWRLPPPDGDTIRIVFPFTVSAYDLTGVVSFLQEHFDQFSDVGLGCFMARRSRLEIYPDGTLGLSALLALAPFDLGVTQDFELRSGPSEIKGIDEVHIRLVRKSGEPRDWTRLNKVLLDDLRTQFLLWRSLPAETMEVYRQRTLTIMQTRGPARPGGGG